MAWTTYDLSEITDQLVNQLKLAAQNSPLWTSEGGTIPNFLINVTGTSPDMTRNGQEGECQLNLYLLHVAQNPYPAQHADLRHKRDGQQPAAAEPLI